MIKNVIFDWSGVISDDLPVVYKTMMGLFKKFGVKEVALEDFKKEWEQPYMLTCNKYVPELTKEKADVLYRDIYKSVISKQSPKLFSYIKDTLLKLNKTGVNMVIISSHISDYLLSDIKEFGLNGLFKEINTEIHDKTEIINKVMKRNNFKPEETIFIDDTTHEIKAGKKGGTKTAAVTWGYQNEDKLKSSNPDFIIHNLKELESVILG